MPRKQPRKPDALKLAEGTWQKYRDGNPQDVVQVEGVPVKPAGLDAEAGELWDAIVPGLTTTRVAAEIDTVSLIGMCEWYGRYRRWSTALDVAGPDHGDAYKMMIQTGMAWKHFAGMAALFGMNPSDRSRLRIEPAKTVGLPKRNQG